MIKVIMMVEKDEERKGDEKPLFRGGNDKSVSLRIELWVAFFEAPV